MEYYTEEKIKQINDETCALLITVGSRYGAYGHEEPPLEVQKEMFDKIESNKEILERFYKQRRKNNAN